MSNQTKETPEEKNKTPNKEVRGTKDSSTLEYFFLGKKQAEKPCRTCLDFRTWASAMGKKVSPEKELRNDCPLDNDTLGRGTWGFLHTMAAHYPGKPSPEQQTDMNNFIHIFSRFYPCSWCSYHLRERLKTDVPQTSSNVSLSQWFCELHNEVNERKGKPKFDCSKVMERWRDGWKDGSCDP